MRAPRPNVFLIGSMKSATTYLSELLRTHPAVFMSVPKEPCHFVDQNTLRKVWHYMWEQGYWRSEERYLSLFADAGAARVIAEASTTYSQAPLFDGVPERILAFNPDARFIYIMRDPVERTISDYWHCVKWWDEHRALMRAILTAPRYTDTSYYARQLREYLRRVDPSRIHVLTCEALVADPLAEISRLYGWLGIDAAFRPNILGAPINVMPTLVDQTRVFEPLYRIKESALYDKVRPLVPPLARRLGYKLATRSPLPVRPREQSTSEVKAYLRPRQRRETEELAALLEREFPEWTTLYGDD